MAQGRSRRRRGQKRGPINDINMTPFIDVMLVLLVIFMVTAPLMSGGVSLDLPKANSSPMQFETKPLTVEINAAGQIFINGQETPEDDFTSRLLAASPKGIEEIVVVRGDKTLPYERVMQIVVAINKAGFKKMSLLSEQSK